MPVAPRQADPSIIQYVIIRAIRHDARPAMLSCGDQQEDRVYRHARHPDPEAGRDGDPLCASPASFMSADIIHPGLLTTWLDDDALRVPSTESVSFKPLLLAASQG